MLRRVRAPQRRSARRTAQLGDDRDRRGTEARARQPHAALARLGRGPVAAAASHAARRAACCSRRATSDLSAGAIGLAYMFGGAGCVLAAATAERLSKRYGVGPVILLGLMLTVVGWVLYGLIGGPVWFATVALGIGMLAFDFGGVLWGINYLALRQAITPDRLLGRMTATMRFLTVASAPLGSLVGGALANGRSACAERCGRSACSACCSPRRRSPGRRCVAIARCRRPRRASSDGRLDVAACASVALHGLESTRPADRRASHDRLAVPRLSVPDAIARRASSPPTRADSSSTARSSIRTAADSRATPARSCARMARCCRSSTRSRARRAARSCTSLPEGALGAARRRDADACARLGSPLRAHADAHGVSPAFGGAAVSGDRRLDPPRFRAARLRHAGVRRATRRRSPRASTH